jgi:hypothetical protein
MSEHYHNESLGPGFRAHSAKHGPETGRRPLIVFIIADRVVILGWVICSVAVAKKIQPSTSITWPIPKARARAVTSAIGKTNGRFPGTPKPITSDVPHLERSEMRTTPLQRFLEEFVTKMT